MEQIERAAIIDALEKGDTVMAQKVMQEHVESVMGKLTGMIAEQIFTEHQSSEI